MFTPGFANIFVCVSTDVCIIKFSKKFMENAHYLLIPSFLRICICVYIYTCTHVYFQICGCDVCVGPSPRHTSRENEGRKPVLWIHEAHPVLPNHFSTNELYSSPRGQNWFQILRTFWIWRHKIPSEMASRARLCRKNLQWNTHSPFKGGSRRLQLNWLSWEM